MKRAAFWAGTFFRVLSVAFLIPFAAGAAETAAPARIVVGTDVDYPPYGMVGPDGQADGFSVDLMKAVCEAVGIDVTFKLGTWSVVRSDLEWGDIDALPLVSPSREREKVFDFTMPHTAAHGAVFKRTDTPGINSVVDLHDRPIIAIRADGGHEWLRRKEVTHRLLLVETVSDAFLLLASGQYEYVVAPRLVGLQTVRRLGLSTIETTGPLLDTYGRGYGFAVRKGDTALLLQLNEGLRIVKETGAYDAIYEKWFGIVDPIGVPVDVLVRYVLLGLAGIGAAGAVAFFWIVILRRAVRARTQELSDARDSLERLIADRTAELRDKNFILDAVINGGVDAIFVKDRAGRILLANDEAARRVGATSGAIVGRTAGELFPEAAEEMAVRDRAIIRSGVGSEFEEVLRTVAGDRIVHTYERPYRDGTGRIIGIIVISRDITERKRAEEALRESEIRLRLLLSGVAVGIGVEDLEGRTLSPNEGLARMLGYTTDELLAMRFTDYTHPDHAGRDAELFREMAAGRRDGYQLEKRYITRDGREIWGRLTRTVVRDDDGRPRYCLGMVEDITERKRAEQALRESEERFAKAFRASPAPMSISTIDGGLTLDVNDEWIKTLGFSREEAIGRTSAELGVWGADQREAFIGRLQAEGSFRDFDATACTKNGEARRVLLAGEIIDGARLLLVFHDITERLQMEGRLAHAQKMEAVGQLTGGVAHDFNNLLQIINARLEIVRAGLEADAPLRGHVTSALQAAARGGKLTQQLLSFSRRQVLLPHAVNPNALVDGLIGMLARTLGEDIEIQTELEPSVPPITVDPHGLENALLNLAVNARSAMPKGGRLTVSTRRRRLAEPFALDDGALPAGDYVEFAVRDTGCGMTAEILERAFEPFFTTKDVGEGSGLGLSMVYGFSRQSGGTATLESAAGQGTTVRLLLPLADRDGEWRKSEGADGRVEAGAHSV